MEPYITEIGKDECSSSVRYQFFGRSFLSSAIGSIAAAKSEDITDAYTESLERAIAVLESDAMANWQPQLFVMATALLRGKTWGLYDLGFNLLEKHQEHLLMDSAQAAVASMFVEIKADASSTESACRREKAYLFLQSVSQRFGKDFFTEKEAASSVNAHFQLALISEDADVRNAAHVQFRQMIAVGGDSFNTTFNVLIEHTVAEMPSQSSRDCFATLVLSAPYVAAGEIEALLTQVTAPLRQYADSDQAAFGAECLTLAVAEKVTPALLVPARKYAEQFAAGATTSYTSVALKHVARVLDAGAAFLDETYITTYVTTLGTHLSTNSEAYIAFALLRLKALTSVQTLSASQQASLSQQLIQQWPYLTQVSNKEMAADVLQQWHENIPESSRTTYLSQQVAVLREAPSAAWNNLSVFWAELPDEQLIEIIECASGIDDLWPRFLSDISRPERKLKALQVSNILFSLGSSIAPEPLKEVGRSLTNPLSQDEKNESANALFKSVLEDVNPSAHGGIVTLASSLQSRISPQGVAYFTELVKADQPSRQVALERIEKFFVSQAYTEDEIEPLASAMGSALTNDQPETVELNLTKAEHTGIWKHPSYKAGLKLLAETHRGANDSRIKSILKSARSLHRRK